MLLVLGRAVERLMAGLQTPMTMGVVEFARLALLATLRVVVMVPAHELGWVMGRVSFGGL